MQTQEFAADTLLERGLPLPIAAPLFLRLFGFKKLACYQPSLGNKIRVNKIYAKMGLTPELLEKISLTDADRLIMKHGSKPCQIIAIGMLKGWLWPLLFSRLLGCWLKWKLKPKAIWAIVKVMIGQSGTDVFMDTTRYIESHLILKPTGQKPNQVS